MLVSKKVIMAASHNAELLVFFAKNWLDTSKNQDDGKDKDDLDLVHFFLACALHLVKDANVHNTFVTELLKYRVIDVLLLIKLKKYKEAAQVIQANCKRDSDWWYNLDLGTNGNDRGSYYWAWESFSENEGEYKDALRKLFYSFLVKNKLRNFGVIVQD